MKAILTNSGAGAAGVHEVGNANEGTEKSRYRRDNHPNTLRRVTLFLQRRFAQRRFKLLYDSLGLTELTRVLDLGGTYQYWGLAQELGFLLPNVTIVNLSDPDSTCRGQLGWVRADVRSVPFRDLSFDAVVSNSVIEHLGDRASQQAFAGEVRRLAPSYFVQTPNRGFPVEPHFVAPLIHWFPKRAQRRLIRNFSLYGILSRPSRPEIEQLLAELQLLTPREMIELFTGAKIITEKALGLPKSIIACKRPTRRAAWPGAWAPAHAKQ